MSCANPAVTLHAWLEDGEKYGVLTASCQAVRQEALTLVLNKWMAHTSFRHHTPSLLDMDPPPLPFWPYKNTSYIGWQIANKLVGRRCLQATAQHQKTRILDQIDERFRCPSRLRFDPQAVRILSIVLYDQRSYSLVSRISLVEFDIGQKLR